MKKTVLLVRDFFKVGDEETRNRVVKRVLSRLIKAESKKENG